MTQSVRLYTRKQVYGLAQSGMTYVAVSFLVKLAYLPSRPWYCCHRSIHPHQLHRPSSCLVPFQGILTPPLVSQGGRPQLNIGSVCVSLSLLCPMQRRPPIIRPCLPSLIRHCHHNTRFRPGVRALISHTAFLTGLGGNTRLPSPTQALWLFIQNTFVSPSFISGNYKKGNEPVLIQPF